MVSFSFHISNQPSTLTNNSLSMYAYVCVTHIFRPSVNSTSEEHVNLVIDVGMNILLLLGLGLVPVGLVGEEERLEMQVPVRVVGLEIVGVVVVVVAVEEEGHLEVQVEVVLHSEEEEGHLGVRSFLHFFKIPSHLVFLFSRSNMDQHLHKRL
jgi:hypothetical protein